jgi:Do/DeqQ family serine protease
MKSLRPLLLALILVGAFYVLTTHTRNSAPSWITRPEHIELTEASGPPTYDNEEQENISVYKKGLPSVVNITSTAVAYDIFYGAVPQQGMGSGFVIDAEGHILTNYHVIQSARQVEVTTSDKKKYKAQIIGVDPPHDLAVIQIPSKAVPQAEIGDSKNLIVGQKVYAIGNPFGLSGTMTRGIISSIRSIRTADGAPIDDAIQTDAAINPGNSGGALVDLGGRLVGINTAIFSRSGGSQGIGFAIPANMVRGVIASAKGGAHVVRRPWLGAKLQTVTPEIADSLSLKRPAGALVNVVTPRSPAARAGLRTGDVIVDIDGQPVEDPNAFDYRFATKPLGGQAQVGVLRGGREAKVAIPLETAPETPREETVIKARSPLSGAKVANLSPAVAEELRLNSEAQGVAVTEVENGSVAQSFGFQKGDIVVSINNTKIANMQDLLRVTNQPSRLWRLTILRGGQEISAVFGG